jgi:hypothetical protein
VRLAALPCEVIMLARDRLSHARLADVRASALEQTADVAFLLQPGEPMCVRPVSRHGRPLHARSGSVLGVNRRDGIARPG